MRSYDGLKFVKNNSLRIKLNLDLGKLMTGGDSHRGVVQLKNSSRLPVRHSRAHCSHKDGEKMTWIWSLVFLHILSHMKSVMARTVDAIVVGEMKETIVNSTSICVFQDTASMNICSH